LVVNENIYVKLLEHNNWANRQIIMACSGLSADQLDAKPHSQTKGTIRDTLTHLVTAQRGYLALLTLPPDQRPREPVAHDGLLASAEASGEGLEALAANMPAGFLTSKLRTSDGYFVEPWVVLVQVINHATEHREQIKSMLSGLGLTPPGLDGWEFGEATLALVPIAEE
jgi:uncharacterized damage-inducible protein DinB